MATRRRTARTAPQRITAAAEKKMLASLEQKTKLVTTRMQTLAKQQNNLFDAYVSAHVIPYVEQFQVDVTPVLDIYTDATRNDVVSAVKYGIDMWRLQAYFANITIMGQTAIGNSGCLQGPDIKPWISQAPSVYASTGYKKLLVDAVAAGVAENFKFWMDSVTVPGLPWYPIFAAFAGPFAPPMPNIPMPLIVCVSQNMNKLMSPTQMENAITARLPADMRTPEASLFLYPLSVNVANAFTTWLCSQQVMMVMGMGPVPTYNPPYVPVGAVVNGYVIPSPGHLAA